MKNLGVSMIVLATLFLNLQSVGAIHLYSNPNFQDQSTKEQKKEPQPVSKDEAKKIIDDAKKKNADLLKYLESERKKFGKLTDEKIAEALDRLIKMASGQKKAMDQLAEEIEQAKNQDEVKKALDKFFRTNNMENFIEAHRRSVLEHRNVSPEHKKRYYEEMDRIKERIKKDTITRDKVFPKPKSEPPKKEEKSGEQAGMEFDFINRYLREQLYVRFR